MSEEQRRSGGPEGCHQTGLRGNHRAPSLHHTERRGCSKARQGKGWGAGHSLQADVRGQLEGVFQYVELLDLPRLPSVNSPRYLKGPGIPLFSGTGLQEVLGGCSSLQLNEELWEETASQTSTQRPSGQENGGGAAMMTGPQQTRDTEVWGLSNAQPPQPHAVGGLQRSPCTPQATGGSWPRKASSPSGMDHLA